MFILQGWSWPNIFFLLKCGTDLILSELTNLIFIDHFHMWPICDQPYRKLSDWNSFEIFFFLSSPHFTGHAHITAGSAPTPSHLCTEVPVITRKRAKAMQQDFFCLLTLIMNSQQAAHWPLEQIIFMLILLPEQWWIVKKNGDFVCLGCMRILIGLAKNVHVDCVKAQVCSH